MNKEVKKEDEEKEKIEVSTNAGSRLLMMFVMKRESRILIGRRFLSTG